MDLSLNLVEVLTYPNIVRLVVQITNLTNKDYSRRMKLGSTLTQNQVRLARLTIAPFDTILGYIDIVTTNPAFVPIGSQFFLLAQEAKKPCNGKSGKACKSCKTCKSSKDVTRSYIVASNVEVYFEPQWIPFSDSGFGALYYQKLKTNTYRFRCGDNVNPMIHNKNLEITRVDGGTFEVDNGGFAKIISFNAHPTPVEPGLPVSASGKWEYTPHDKLTFIPNINGQQSFVTGLVRFTPYPITDPLIDVRIKCVYTFNIGVNPPISIRGHITLE